MSGGSMDYLYQRVEDASFREDTPERRAFRKHLTLVAKALHDIEWVDSCDYGRGDETAAILACLPAGAVLISAIEEAQRVHRELGEQIERAGQGKEVKP